MTSVGLTWLIVYRYTCYTSFRVDSSKVLFLQTPNNANNPIKTLTNPNSILTRFFFCFFVCLLTLNIYKHPKHQQHQYYHDRLKIHRYQNNLIFFILWIEKIFKHCLKIMDQHLFLNALDIYFRTIKKYITSHAIIIKT